MRYHEFVQPTVGDVLEIAMGDVIVETVIVEISEDGIICENNDLEANMLLEAEYQGRKVKLGKPFLTPDGPKKRAVYVRNPKTGNVLKVSFGDKNMRIKKSNRKRRKSFRARHNCANPGPRTRARYWSCQAW